MLYSIEFTNMPIIEAVPLYKGVEIPLEDFNNETDEWDAFDIYTPIADDIAFTSKTKEHYKEFIKGHNHIRVNRGAMNFEAAEYLKMAAQDGNLIINGVQILYLFDFAIYDWQGTPKIEVTHVERKTVEE